MTFKPDFEALRATGTEVFSAEDGTRVCRILCSPNTFCLEQARGYAQLFAQAPNLYRTVNNAIDSLGLEHPVAQRLLTAISACEPKKPGEVFRRTSHKIEMAYATAI